MWVQKTLEIARKPRGCHLIQNEIERQVPELSEFKVGIANFFLQHTSASLTINENYDSDVRVDMERILNHVCPESLPYEHTMEGKDDMPAHGKSTLCGVSLNIPIKNGKLALGTWQGIWLLEHRDRAHSRSIIVTIQGEPNK